MASPAKRYSSLKYSLTIIETAYLLIVLFVFLGSGLSRGLTQWISGFTTLKLLVIPLYILVISIAYYALSFPLTFYHSYSLEHKFSLSNQSLRDWFLDQFKSGVIFYIISLILISAFYYILELFADFWWLVISVFWIFFSLIMAKLLPIVIIPLFFKYKKLADEGLRERVLKLARTMKIKILDVFEIDFSRKTLKANAAFVGWGSTRRVILADTLKDKYSYDEIEVILAHEFAHYRLKHLLKLILINSAATIVTFYIIFKTSGYALDLFGFSSLSDIAALPVVIAYFILFGVMAQPFENFISRALERNADKMALKITGLKEAFISTMDKLGEQNLADKSPHPIIKFYFFDHPPIDERINMAKSFR